MNSASLSGFLALTGAQYCVVDLGSQLRSLSSAVLDCLDNGQPYAHPYLGYAWLSIILWNPENPAQNSFWFLKLPLDENGILVPGVHSDLVNRLYRSVSTQDEAERHRLINDHPYQFKPNEEKQAALHAYASVQLAQRASLYYETCLQCYVEGTPTDWRELGLQGIADLVQRLTQEQEEKMVARLTTMQSEALIALCHQLEHRPISDFLSHALMEHADSSTINEQLAILRACSQSAQQQLIIPKLASLLNAHDNSLELVLLIISRYAAALLDDDFALTVFDRLAHLADSEGFNRLVQTTALLPGMHGFVMRLLRHAKLTISLANALGRMIQMQRGHHAQH